MELRQLRYFCAVAEELNLTRAADRLHMAQPPLSRQIKALETELGAPLFIRQARGLALTPTGQFFLEHVLQILERVDTTVTATRRMARRGHQVFGIGMVGSLLYGQLPQLIRRLRQTDDIELLLLELTTVNQIHALKAGRIDIGFGRLRLDDPDIEQEILFDEPIVAALPANHPLSNTTPTLAQLAEYPLIIYPASPRPSYADAVLSLFRLRGLKVRVVQETNELQTAIGLVASDLGFSLVPEQVMRMHRDEVKYVRLAEKNITSPIICSRRREPTTPAMILTNEILKELVNNRRLGHYP
ncbi:MAG: LysR family transcriptional regulator [Pseudomonadota bacterium]|nr:LysR family transcriptional regulator [Pseudomonadota bacterium]